VARESTSHHCLRHFPRCPRDYPPCRVIQLWASDMSTQGGPHKLPSILVSMRLCTSLGALTNGDSLSQRFMPGRWALLSFGHLCIIRGLLLEWGLLHDPWPSALDGAATRGVPFVISLCTTLSSHAEAAGANAPNHGGGRIQTWRTGGS
jgi:hypothetical protein